MNRYLLFKGNCYYPSGGAGDLHKKTYKTLDGARTTAEAWTKKQAESGLSDNWFHIFDTESMTIVYDLGDDDEFQCELEILAHEAKERIKAEHKPAIDWQKICQEEFDKYGPMFSTITSKNIPPAEVYKFNTKRRNGD